MMWEYHRVDLITNSVLNELGRKGWELVAIHPVTLQHVFKREHVPTNFKPRYVDTPRRGPRR